MRLHTDAVDRAGGVITSNGELVTGVVYATSGTPDILTIENVLAGRVVGEAEADSPWRVVCVTEEDADREYAIGDLEHGIQYVFDPDGRLAEEEEFSHGELVEARTWFDSGAIASRTCYSTSGVNSECWHESGQLAGIERLGVSVRYHLSLIHI